MVDLEIQAHKVQGYLGAFGPAQIAAHQALDGKLSDEEIEKVKSAICDKLTDAIAKEDWTAYHAVYR